VVRIAGGSFRSSSTPSSPPRTSASTSTRASTLGIAARRARQPASGGRGQGASTITMQVARNFFLSREKTYNRKLYESCSPSRSSRTSARTRSSSSTSTRSSSASAPTALRWPLAPITARRSTSSACPRRRCSPGCPRRPRLQPVVNPRAPRAPAIRAAPHARGSASSASAIRASAQAFATPQSQRDTVVARKGNRTSAAAPTTSPRWPARSPSSSSAKRPTAGHPVITTVTASRPGGRLPALRRGVIDYDRRHGYRGAEPSSTCPRMIQAEGEARRGARRPPTTTTCSPRSCSRPRRRRSSSTAAAGDPHHRQGPALRAPMLGDKAPAQQTHAPRRDRAHAHTGKGRWEIAQLPEVQAALVAIDPHSGACARWIGGFDFNRNKFNHVTQAWRQPGSSFKPFIYSAALDRGSARAACSTTRRSTSRPASPAARPGSRRTTTAATPAR
jgi:penicillin-binding protein 1A